MAARARVMITAANVPMVERYCLFQEAANHSTKLDWLTVVKLGGEKKHNWSTMEWQFHGGAKIKKTNLIGTRIRKDDVEE